MHKSKRQQNLPMAKVASADAEIKLPRSGQIKDDHPVVQLTTRNYVDFMYGFIGHMSSKRVGGADVKFYLQNEGAEPDFNSESAELKSEFSTMDRNRHVLMSKTKRLEQKLATANNLLQSATAELSKIKKQLKRRTPIPSSQDPDLQDDDLPFNASRHMDDQSVSSIGSFNANPPELSDQEDLISALAEQVADIEFSLDNHVSEEAQAQTNGKLLFQQLDVINKEISDRKKAFRQAKLEGLRDLLDTPTFIPADKKAEMIANIELHDSIENTRQSADLFTVLQLITQGLQVEEPKSKWQLIELKEQFKLLKPKEGEKLAQWKSKFDMHRIENIRRGVIFDDNELIHFAMRQIEENYKYKFIIDYFKPFKVSPSDPTFRDLHSSFDDMMKELTTIIIREQESTKNVVQNAVFDLTSTKTEKRADKIANVATAKVVNKHVDKTKDTSKTEEKKKFPPPFCKLGCMENGKPALHRLEDCFHPSQSDITRAAAKKAREEYWNNKKLEKNVKAVQLRGNATFDN